MELKINEQNPKQILWHNGVKWLVKETLKNKKDVKKRMEEICQNLKT